MDKLPTLMDAKAIAEETGQTRAFALTVIRNIPKVQVPGFRRVLVRREDVLRYLEEAMRK